MSNDVDATISALQWIPGGEEDVADGGHPTNSAMMQVFYENEGIETPSSIPDLTVDPVFDTWLKGDQTREDYNDLLPEVLGDPSQTDEGTALSKKSGKHRDEFGNEAFNNYRFHNEVSISFDTDGDSVVPGSVAIEFPEVGREPDDPTVTTGDRDNSWTVTPDHELNMLPLEEWHGDGDTDDPELYRTRSNRATRYYDYDTSFEFDGVEGVRVTTLAGGWVGYARDWTENIGENSLQFLSDMWDWPIPDEALTVAGAAMPARFQLFLDFFVKIPRAYALLDVVVLADGRRYVRIWDASQWPSVATYVDSEASDVVSRRAYDKMPYEPNQRFNIPMTIFHILDSAGLNPYSSLYEYERLLDDPEALERAIEDVLGPEVRDVLNDLFPDGYSTNTLMPDVPRMTVAVGADGEEIENPGDPFGEIQGLFYPMNGEIEQRTHTITLESADGDGHGYSFAVDGNLEKSAAYGATLDSNDTIDGKEANGYVNGGTDSYEFTGQVRWFDGDGLDVYIDGEEADPGDSGEPDAGIAGPTAGQVGEELTFTAEVMNFDGAPEFSWELPDGDGGIISDDGQSTTHAFSSAGSYEVAVQVTSDSDEPVSGSRTVDVEPVPCGNWSGGWSGDPCGSWSGDTGDGWSGDSGDGWSGST